MSLSFEQYMRLMKVLLTTNEEETVDVFLKYCYWILNDHLKKIERYISDIVFVNGKINEKCCQCCQQKNEDIISLVIYITAVEKDNESVSKMLWKC